MLISKCQLTPICRPTTDEVFSTLAQGELFSTLDLARAYKQMVVAPDSRAC